jgi:hypothetical protein
VAPALTDRFQVSTRLTARIVPAVTATNRFPQAVMMSVAG